MHPHGYEIRVLGGLVLGLGDCQDMINCTFIKKNGNETTSIRLVPQLG